MKSISILLAAGVSTLVLASAAQAADLIIDTEPMMPGIVEISSSWDGPFIGVFGGYGWGELGFDTDAPGDISPEGWLLGVNAGANFTLGNGIVAGVVGDIAWSDMNDTYTGELAGDPPTIASASSTIDWVGSLRGRIGLDAGAFMPYLTAGLAVAHNTFETNVPTDDSDEQIHVGWTVGAGVEVAVADNMSLDLQYRYSDYGDATYTLNGTDGEIGLTSHALTVGLNFGF